MSRTSADPKSPRRGVTLLLTGLPLAGKSSHCRAPTARIENDFGWRAKLLDGDEARQLLSPELGYSREHRRRSALRLRYIATEVSGRRRNLRPDREVYR